MWLTDSQQKKLLDELYSTTRRFRAALRDVMPEINAETKAEIAAIREYVEERRAGETKVKEAAKRAVLQFLGHIGWIKK